jgi:hypothetical protein
VYEYNELTGETIRMKKALRILALLFLVTGLTWWLVAGANRGWTKTLVPVKIVDEVTGIEGVQYQPRFVPGVDFLALAVMGSGVLLGISWLFRNQSTTTHNTP